MYKAKNAKKGKNGSENNRKRKKGAPKMAQNRKKAESDQQQQKGKKEKDGRIAKTQPEPSNSNGKTQTSKKAGLPQVLAECQAYVPGRVTGEWTAKRPTEQIQKRHSIRYHDDPRVKNHSKWVSVKGTRSTNASSTHQRSCKPATGKYLSL